MYYAFTLYHFYIYVINKTAVFSIYFTVGPQAQQACQILNRAEFAKLKIVTSGRKISLCSVPFIVAKLQELDGSYE